MKILCINNGHNATAALFENGTCLGIYHEEKFNNIKNFTGIPFLSIDYINTKYSISDIDLCVFTFTEQIISQGENIGTLETIGKTDLRDFYNYLEYKTANKKLFGYIRDFIVNKKLVPSAQKKIKKLMKERFGIADNKIIFTDHHQNHCLTPLYFYNLSQEKENILLISLDGTGDGYCSKVYVYNPKFRRIKELLKIRYENSIGLLYREMTRYLGMKPLEHEYKVMGLAAYVSEDKYFADIYNEFKKIMRVNNKTRAFESNFNTNISYLFMKDKFVGKRFDNLAAALQKFTEDLVTEWIQLLIKKTKVKTVALSGGVFMNVKLNKKIIELKDVKKVYVQPSCGDESLVIGAAADQFIKNNISLSPIKTMYLGHEYTNEQIEQFIQQNKLDKIYHIEFFKDIEKQIAQLLATFEIVPRFTGRSEWGARSLCNRAILANASDLKSFHEVNDQVKMRDFWMPFAPTILDSWTDKYIQYWNIYKRKSFDSTKYMILSFDTTPLAQKHLLAALHQKDKTIRPQIVSEGDNPSLYKLMKYYEKYTGMGGLLNTSLNIHGYPLVATLSQALFTFKNSGLKYMNLENYLIKKI